LDFEAPCIFTALGVQQENTLVLAALDPLQGVNGFLDVLLRVLLDGLGFFGGLDLGLPAFCLFFGLLFLLGLSGPAHDVFRLIIVDNQF
jgi:hypothetical protein